MSREVKSQIYYYARKGWYQHVVSLCDQVMSKKGKDPTLLFWKGLGIGMLHGFYEAKSFFEILKGRRDFLLPVSTLLLHFAKRSESPDEEFIYASESEIMVAEESAKDTTLVLTARVCLLLDASMKSFSFCERILKQCSDLPSTPVEWEAKSIHTWSLVKECNNTREQRSDTRSQLQEVYNYFETQQDALLLDPDLLILESEIKLILNMTCDDIIATYDVIVANYPTFSSILGLKAILLATENSWDHALEAAQIALDEDKYNIDAMMVIAVHAFTHESQSDDAIRKFEDLRLTIVDNESKSIQLLLEIASVFSIICSRDIRILQKCIDILLSIENSVKTPLQQSKLHTKLGDIYLKMGIVGYENSMNHYKLASTLEPNNMDALEGMIHCQISEGLFDDAESQIEVVSLMHESNELSAKFFYLRGLLSKRMQYKKDRSNRESGSNTSFIEQSFQKMREESISTIEGKSFLSSYSYFTRYDPDFYLQLAKEYLEYGETLGLSINLLSVAANIKETENGMNIELGHYNFNNASGNEKLSQNDETLYIPPIVEKGISILKEILSKCPGITIIYIELARCYINHHLFDDAMKSLESCLYLNPNCAIAFVVKAIMEIQKRNPKSANQVLEQALSLDFGIRATVIFRIVQVISKVQLGKYEDCLLEIEEITDLPEVRSNNLFDVAGLSDGGINQSSTKSGDLFRLTNDERVAAFVAHAIILSKLHRMKEANKILKDSLSIFKGLPQETHLLVAYSDLAIQKKDYDAAIRALDKIKEDNIFFTNIQKMKAYIILNFVNDKEGYIQCFENLVSIDPSTKSLIALAEAYLRVLNPEAAIHIFEEAYRKNPKASTRLLRRIGQLLVFTHQFHRAISFYNNAVENLWENEKEIEICIELCHAAAQLHEKLGNIVESKKILEQILNEQTGLFQKRVPGDDFSIIINKINTLVFLAKIECKQSNYEIVKNILRSAVELQKTWSQGGINTQNTVGTLSTGNQRSMKLLMSTVCCEIVDIIRKNHLFDSDEWSLNKCRSVYEEVLMYNPNNVYGMLGLAIIFKELGDLRKCESQCQSLLLLNSNIEDIEVESCVLLSKVSSLICSKQNIDTDDIFSYISTSDMENYDKKTAHRDGEDEVQAFPEEESSIMKTRDYTTDNSRSSRAKTGDNLPPSSKNEVIKSNSMILITEKFPNNYIALEQLIFQKRAKGELVDIQSYLDLAERSDGRAKRHPGYHYCRGLYLKFTNNTADAIIEFNAARRDDKWGRKSLEAMINLYLNPNQDGAWEDHYQDTTADQHMEKQVMNNLQTVKFLLSELKLKDQNDARNYKIMEGYYLLSTKSKSNVQEVLQTTLQILEQDENFLPAILLMAIAYMADKDLQKARNTIKRVTQVNIDATDYQEEFERSHLLLAKFQIEKDQFDIAQDTIKKVLHLNRSSTTSWELMGLMMEKDLKYRKAALCYEQAWRLDRQTNASLGYKLAFCCMKSKNYIKSIEVCEYVLEKHPNYPKLKDEILSTSAELLRSI